MTAAFSLSKIEELVSRREELSSPLPITLLLDNIRDPGNMGSILRVAAAIGCKKVLATTGCVNPWNPKTLRAAAGSHLLIPISRNIQWHDIHNHVPKYAQVKCVCVCFTNTRYDHLPLAGGTRRYFADR